MSKACRLSELVNKLEVFKNGASVYLSRAHINLDGLPTIGREARLHNDYLKRLPTSLTCIKNTEPRIRDITITLDARLKEERGEQCRY
jgi:hypothetical protein